MKHFATAAFWSCYRHLPLQVQALDDKNFALLKADQNHPSLHVKKVGELWSARVGLHHRALATADGGDLVWFWIGSHGDYDRMIG